jgi:hypothetical protein
MMIQLGISYMDDARYDEAEPLLQKVVDVQCRVVGERHPDTLIMMRNLGRLYDAEGKRVEAERLLSKVVKAQTNVLGPEHPDTLISAHRASPTFAVQACFRLSHRNISFSINVDIA